MIPRNSKVGALISVRPRAMGSQELSANLNNSISVNTEPDKAVVKGDSAKSRIAEYGSVSNNLDNFEWMTVQELREKLRSMGVPAKGSKRDLVCALKTSFMKEVNDEDSQEVVEDEVSPKMNQFHGKTKSKRKGNSSLCEDYTESGSMDDEASVDKKIKRRAKQVTTDINVISETSVSKQANRRVKQMQVESASIRVESVTCKNKKEPVMKTNKVTGKKYTFLKKDISSQVDPEDVGASERMDVSEHQIEPWTVLAHKKPQKSWIPYNPRNMRSPPLAGDTRRMKLMSWNVNGLRALMKLESFSALKLAQREDFDVLCLQETKLQEKDVEAIKQALLEGYENSFWTCSVSKLGYSGTAIVSRITPLSVRYGLGISDHDSEGRLVTAEFDSFYLISGYVPNSGDGLRRLSYRTTEWDPSLSSYMKELEKSKPVILTGDLNCAHEEIDIYNPAGNKRSAGFTIEERKSFETNFLDKGFVDTFRKQHPDVVGYTYWGYRHGGRKTNKGWRLDYFLVSQSIADNVHDSFILPDVAGSDHCPIGLVLKI